jgi:hypothetical protein
MATLVDTTVTDITEVLEERRSSASASLAGAGPGQQNAATGRQERIWSGAARGTT